MTNAVRISGLTRNNVAALRELFPRMVADGSLELTATTATFARSADDAAYIVGQVLARTPGRGHPRASLHAVLRKLLREVGS